MSDRRSHRDRDDNNIIAVVAVNNKYVTAMLLFTAFRGRSAIIMHEYGNTVSYHSLVVILGERTQKSPRIRGERFQPTVSNASRAYIVFIKIVSAYALCSVSAADSNI